MLACHGKVFRFFPGCALKIRNPLFIRCVGSLLARLLQLLFRTLRLEIACEAGHINPYEVPGSLRYIYMVWHDSMLVPTFGGKQTYTAALTSRHQDGLFVASAMRTIGMETVRGSTGRGGGVALREMISTAKRKHIVITPDGPRGPRRTVSPGIVYLASRSGLSIVPTASSCVRRWTIKGSWTDLWIPKPFTRTVMIAAAPITVPSDLSREELRPFVEKVQREMDRVNKIVEDQVHPDEKS